MLFQIKNKKNSCKFKSDLCNDSILPNEIISKIYQHLPTEDLLQLYLLNSSTSHLSHLANQEILKRFEKCELGLRLYFEQESKWKYTLDFKLLKHDKNDTLLFIPMVDDKKKKSSIYFYHSKMLRRPVLYKVSLISSKQSGDQFKNIPINLLNKSQPINIKQFGQFHYQQDQSLFYSIHETPSHLIKKIPGERIFLTHAFQCQLDWLCQTKSFLNKWVDLLHNHPQPRPMSSNHFTTTEISSHHQSQLGQVVEINTLMDPISLNHHLSYKSSIGSTSLVPNLLSY